MTHITLSAFDHYLLCMLVYGVNIQAGQPLLIMANQSETSVIERLTELAVSLKTGPIEVLFIQDFKTKTSDDLIEKAKANWAFLKLNMFERFTGSDDQATLMDQFSRFLKPLSDYSQHGLIQSCSSVIPSLSWASSLYPDLSSQEALDRLSDQLIKAAHCDRSDYFDQCAKHYDHLSKKVSELNALRLQKLTFKSPTCNLEIGLNEDHVWVGGSQLSKGIAYLPNFPTQEVFTANSKHQIDGWFKITRPFRFRDALIHNLTITIKDGLVTDLNSTENITAFKEHLWADPSRRYFGEIALVDPNNPIAKLDTIFNCVLLDENAVCHMALGNAYPVCSNDHERDLQQDRINHSDLHLDLMIGSNDLDSQGYDGKQWFTVNR